ncbi:MAG: aldo/keto reductase, partial [Christensenellales bacterium]
KCGIVSTPEGTYYDFSEKHILEACDASLKRLQTDYIDVYLLHRPDALYEPQEIASAFDKLQAAGKVKHFGVSNMNTMQMKMIQKYVRQPLVCNQLQFTLGHTKLIDQSISVNRAETASIGHDDGLLDYCRYTDCTVQAWSPFRAAKSPVTGSIIEGKIMTRPFIGSPEYLELNAAMDKMSAELGITPGALTVAWILRHPADMQVVLGSTRPERIRDACQGVNVELSRKQWYDLYRAAGNLLM